MPRAHPWRTYKTINTRAIVRARWNCPQRTPTAASDTPTQEIMCKSGTKASPARHRRVTGATHEHRLSPKDGGKAITHAKIAGDDNSAGGGGVGGGVGGVTSCWSYETSQAHIINYGHGALGPRDVVWACVW